MRILVVGRGFLGRAFERKGILTWGRKEFQPEVNIKRVDEFDVVVNCIGKSDTRWCETNFMEAFYSNAIIPKGLSAYCNKNNIRFVHVSTGCLYDKVGIENKETDFLSAHCNYTVTKWSGENFCNSNDLIIRPRLLFGTEKSDKNLICKLPKFDKFLTEVNSYTSVDVIVDAVLALIEAGQKGIFNVACDGTATVKELAGWIGVHGEDITAEELVKRENLYLVNNVMCLNKLKNFYEPPKLHDEVMRCYESICKED